MKKLYYIRAIFSVIWAILLIKSPFATILLIIYPLWDVLGTVIDIKNNPQANKTPQYVNAAISIVTTIAVAIVIGQGVPQTLIVFGIWAILTGAIQLILGIRRRKTLNGQWPMIISGGQSMLGGTSFIVFAHDPTKGISSLAGYAAFGAFYYLLAAYRLSKNNVDKA